VSRTKTTRSSAGRRDPGPPAHEVWPGVTIRIDDCGRRYWFDAAEADRMCAFFPRYLVHYQGEFAGKPFELEPWQRDLIIRPVFGWRRTSDGLRRFRKVYLAVAKKNGKSTLAAGVALLLLFCDGEPGAQIYSAAADKEQAAIVFDTAKTMVEQSPRLSRRCEIYRRSIVVPNTFSSYKVLSADVKSKHGPNIHGLIFDELHAQPSRELYDTLAKGVAARRQPLTFEITTAGDNLESICREEHDYAEKVIAGVIEDETFLPVIFAARPEEDWRDPAVWRRANPSFGTTVKSDYLQAEVSAAIADPRKQAAFKRLHLNIWTQQHQIWIPIEDWDACAAPVSPNDLAGRACFGGVDLSTKLDLTCLVLAFRRFDEPDARADAPELELGEAAEPSEGPERRLTLNFTVDLLPFFWIPEDTMHRRAREDNVPYPLWAELGLVRPTPGNVVDYDLIYEQIIEEIAPRFSIQQIGYDPYNATQFALNLQSAGFQMVEVRQGIQTMSEPAKVFEALVQSRRLRHDGHKVLRWNVSNVAVKEDRKGNIFPFKQAQKKRIDGVIGAVIALSRMIVSLDEGSSVYESRGPLVFG
jgi:phage terminase large subunit-like protein